VTDEDGNVDDAEVRVSLNNSPPSVQIATPADGSTYSMAGPTVVPVTSIVSDAEHSGPALSCSLLVELVHNNHAHPEPLISACNANVTITPAGCDGNEYAWRFTLTVTDAEGLSASDTVEMLPQCTPAVCGNGVVEAPEACDDGDLTPGDCCSPECTFEPLGSACPSDGNVCSQDVCDGSGTCTHPAEADGTPCTDDDACTGNDQCLAATCTGQPLPDFDLDGTCDAQDPDDDGDGVPDAGDAAPFNRFACRDADADTCDDCSSGTDAPAGDGPDLDGDGLCDAGDDSDGDGVVDALDQAPLDRFACRDADADTCDDCSSGTDAPASDGPDLDGDGTCDAADDSDGDGVVDAADQAPLDRFACRDADADTCDDCTSGTDAPASDGPDLDGDGLCDAADDSDGDGVVDALDQAPLDRFACRDADADTCDDCTSGTDAPAGDGRDTDGDGACDAGDPDDDADGIADGSDNCPFYASADPTDTDGDGRGNVCECTDQNGDGRNNVVDLLAINRAIFNPALVTPLCDGNNDGLCSVNDIIAANVEIYSPTSTSTCARQPIPGP
jgi:cysteine-rich repeat protein